MKKKVLFAVLGAVIVLLSVFAVIIFTRDASRPEDPVEEAMKSITVYTEEGFHLYLSEDGSYYTFGNIGDFNGTELVIPAYYNGIPIKKLSSSTFIGTYRDQIKTVSIPDTVEEIAVRIYSDVKDRYPMKFNEYNNGYYLGNAENPFYAFMFYSSDIGTKAVLHKDTKVIADAAFEECEHITSVTLPEGLKSIGTQAFGECKSLITVTIPDSVTFIGDFLFSKCEKLEKVTVGSGVSEIRDYMFKNCGSLKTVEIKGNITRIGNRAFDSCLSITNFEIPASVTEIDSQAFKHCDLKKITAHKGILNIGRDAFPKYADYNEYRGGLYIGDSQNPYMYLVGIENEEAESLVLHRDTYSVAQNFIPQMNTLKSLSIDGGKGRYLQIEGNCIIRKENKTLLCGIGTSIIPSSGIEEIAHYAFYRCDTLKSVILPKSLKKIGNSAFNGCTSLSSIEFGKNVEEIGEAAFSGCESLDNLVLPKSLIAIPDDCFHGCTSLSEISITENTEVIGEHAFSGCTALTAISLPGVKVIRNLAFMDCKTLEKVSFSNELGYIGVSVFYGCTALKDIVLPYGLRYIGSAAFENCDSIKYLNIPKSVENFGSKVYAQCNSLEYAIIPEGVESLSAREFEICTSLKKISLPSTLKEISGYAVLGLCESLEEIVYNGTVDEWNAIEKSDAWYISTPACKVICTDGEVELPANESDYVGSW
ncbi:MAG: leucine-rich repeat domain-containing protein [Clostridia bacterium]|nr:leucine-rich repeat domain-containing protein [Clostridia bacterium]